MTKYPKGKPNIDEIRAWCNSRQHDFAAISARRPLLEAEIAAKKGILQVHRLCDYAEELEELVDIKRWYFLTSENVDLKLILRKLVDAGEKRMRDNFSKHSCINYDTALTEAKAALARTRRFSLVPTEVLEKLLENQEVSGE